MMNDSVNPNHIGDDSVATTRMTTQSTPTAHRTPLGHRLQRALAGGSNRRFPGLHPSPGGVASLSPFLNRRPALPILAILALLAASLLFLLPGGPLHAQDADTIEYAENRIDAVTTFTAADPEDRKVYWSVLAANSTDLPIDVDGDGNADIVAADTFDAVEFSISSGGVLSFKFSPDYEMPMVGSDEKDSTTYKVVVVASDDAPGVTDSQMGYEKVTVNVTDVDEPGVVTLSAQQGQINVALTATLADDDATPGQIIDAKWKWEHSSAANGPWTVILTGTDAVYTPLGVEDKYLRVTATYTDGHGSDKSAMAMSTHAVRAAPPNNATPVFTDEDPDEDDIQVDRKVDENSPPGTNVGKPVAADDSGGGRLHYTLTDSTNSFDIHPATGQITVAARVALDADEGTPTREVTVMATDPWGPDAEPTGRGTQTVTITINNVNEAPAITAGATKISVDENTAITDQVSLYTAADVDQTVNVTWSVGGTDAADFEISNEEATLGQLTFKKLPDYEKPVDSNRDNVYMVTVVATDAGVNSKNKMTAERAVVVTVANMVEAGTVTLLSVQPKIGFPLTASVTDPDDGETGITWKWERDQTGGAAPGGTPTLSCSGLGTDAWEAAEEDMGAKTATYTPDVKDEGKCLRATAMYTDGNGMDEAMGVSDNAVIKDLANKAPEFRAGGVDSDADTAADTGGVVTSAKRSIAENVAPNTDVPANNPANVGMPVAAYDPNGADDKLTYTLSGNDAGSFMIGPSNGQISAKMKLDREAKSSHMVKVTATDPNGADASIDVTITVTNVDDAPVIAGDDITKDYRENGTAQVTRFTAADPESRKVYWSVLAANSTDLPIDVDGDGNADIVAADTFDAVEFSISSGGVLSFKFSPDYEMPMVGSDEKDSTTYKVVVVASDDAPGVTDRQMGYKKVTVNVTDVEETETITLSAQQGQIGVALMATYNDLDNEKPDTTELTWTWFLGTSPIADSDAMSYTPTQSGSHRVEASYTKTDGSKKAVSARISVRTPSGSNGTPEFPPGSNARSVDENSPPGTNVGKPVAADDTGGDRLHYTLTDSTNSFDIHPATGQITVAARVALDADEGTPTREVTVMATDPWGPDAEPTGRGTQTVTITINNVNEAPAITAGATKISVDENTAITDQVSLYTAADVDQTVNVTWSVGGTDAADFEISNEEATLGQLTFKKLPDYEKPVDSNRDNVYMVTVVATDAGVNSKNKMTAERAVVVTVANMVEAGTVTLLSVQPKIGFPLTASVTDPDDGETGITWKWERDQTGGAAPGGTPTLSCSGLGTDAWEAAEEDMGAKTATYTPDVKDEGKCLRATAMYTDGNGMDEAMGVSDNAVIKDLANKAPEFRAGGVDSDADTAADTGGVVTSAKRSIAENVAPNTDVPANNPANVGMPVAAYDPNGADDKLTYMLSGNDAGSFMIGPSNGQISAKMKLDREAKSSHMVKVTATDPDGADASIDVTITVTNVDEAPKITRKDVLTNQAPTFSDGAATTREVAENTVAGEDIGAPVAATDADDAALTYTLSGTDAASFDIDPATGQLKTKADLDYETKDSYAVTVTASDSGGLSDSIDVTITVTDVNEAPVAPTVANQTATKDTAFSYTVPAFADPEGDTITYTATLSDDSALPGWLSFNASTRELSGTPLEADTPASLTIKVSATDDGSPSASAQVTFTLTVGEEAPTTLLVRYDDSKDGWIQLEEARDAVGDYFGPPKGVTLSLDDARKVVGLYFEYKNSQ